MGCISRGTSESLESVWRTNSVKILGVSCSMGMWWKGRQKQIFPILSWSGQHREGPIHTLVHSLQALVQVSGAIPCWGIAGDSWTLDPSHELKLDSVMLPGPFLPFNRLEIWDNSGKPLKPSGFPGFSTGKTRICLRPTWVKNWENDLISAECYRLIIYNYYNSFLLQVF